MKKKNKPNTDNALNSTIGALGKKGEDDHKTEEPQPIEDSGEKLYQRSYYLPEKLLKAITLKTVDGKHDKSGVVREALKAYLADILEQMDK